MVQELALAREATVHCGKLTSCWSEFQTAISIFCRHIDYLKPKLIAYFQTTQPRRRWDDKSVFEVDQLGAKLLVDMTATLFRERSNGSLESTIGLETLVCTLSVFDTSDARDTINALRNISKELNRPDSIVAQGVPSPDYKKSLFEVYRDFVEWAIQTSGSLDILCRFWALRDKTTSQATDLPSWLQLAEDSAWGVEADAHNGRKHGDSLVGLPENHYYHASGRAPNYKRPIVVFPPPPIISMDTDATSLGSSSLATHVLHDTSLLVTGIVIGFVDFRTDTIDEGVVPRACLEKLGWVFDRNATEVADVTSQLWQTLVAGRDPNGQVTPQWYKVACQYCLARRSNNGNINIDKILERNDYGGQQSIVRAYLERVRAVTWNRLFIEGKPHCNCGSKQCTEPEDMLVGLAPPKTEKGDIIAILYGCSVPVILHPVEDSSGCVVAYRFVGEAYINGEMDGEAFDEHHDEKQFKLI